MPALEAVLRDVAAAAPGAVVFGGDVFAGPFPRETLALVRSVPNARFVRGNGDRPPDEPSGADAWVHAQLADADRAFVAAWEPTVTIDVAGLGTTLFCHAVPSNDLDVVTEATPEDVFAAAFGGADADVVVCGHTHMQYVRDAGHARVVNAGSVGMPYADRPGAYWALLGPDVDLRRTDFDLDAAAARIRSSAWPQAEEFVAENVLTVPSVAEATAFFERLAGRG